MNYLFSLKHVTSQYYNYKLGCLCSIDPIRRTAISRRNPSFVCECFLLLFLNMMTLASFNFSSTTAVTYDLFINKQEEEREKKKKKILTLTSGT